MSKRQNHDESSDVSSRPARMLENQENQCIAMAYKLAQQRLKDGSASAQEIVHFLKMGTAKTQLEKEKLAAETSLLNSKKEAVDSAKKSGEQYQEALEAFRHYSGQNVDD